MPVSVTMPALGESVTEGTVTRWLKQEGDRVEVDEPLLEVSTDKVDTEIPSPAAGVLERIVVGEDETVEVGGELAVIGDGDGAAATGRPRAGRAAGRRAAAEPRRTPSRRRAGRPRDAQARAGRRRRPRGRRRRPAERPERAAAGPAARGHAR